MDVKGKKGKNKRYTKKSSKYLKNILRYRGDQRILEKILEKMTKNFLNPMKDIKPQIQAIQQLKS